MNREIVIVFYWGTKFRSRLIQFGMWLYQALRWQKPIHSPNHTDTAINMGGKIWYFGARAAGVYPLPNKWILKQGKKEEFTIEVPFETFQTVVHFLHDTTGCKYEFSNFWYFARKIFTGKWHGKSKPNKYFCIEHTAEVMNIIKPGFIKNTRSISPIEFYKKIKKL
jgi:hypothetical protein